MNIMANQYWGFELAWDEVKADAVRDDGDPDGSVAMSGPILSVQGRFPNQTQFTPYAGVGLAFWSADFSEAEFWRYGYTEPEDWVAAGRPDEPLGDRIRTINTDDDTGLVLVGGCIWRFAENWAADIHVRHTDISSDAEFVGTVHGAVATRVPGNFDLSHLSYGVGIRYDF